jgi:hypothetical protein
MQQEHEHVELILILHPQDGDCDKIDAVGAEQSNDAKDHSKQ